MQKSVQITVYAVKSRITNQEHFSGHHRRPLISTTAAAAAAAAGGGGRRAQLLLYSQQLRKIASCQLKAADHKTQTVNKVIKEDVQIASSCKSQERTNGVLKIRTNQNSQQKVAESLIQIASSNRQQQPNAKKVVPVELHKPVITKIPQRPPYRFSDWRKFSLPRFIVKIFGRQNAKKDINCKKKKLSVSLSGKMSAVMLSSRMEKERIGVAAEFLSLTGKRS